MISCHGLSQVLQKEHVLAYTTIEEGEITATRLAQLPDDIDPDRVTFLQVAAPRTDAISLCTYTFQGVLGKAMHCLDTPMHCSMQGLHQVK